MKISRISTMCPLHSCLSVEDNDELVEHVRAVLDHV